MSFKSIVVNEALGPTFPADFLKTSNPSSGGVTGPTGPAGPNIMKLDIELAGKGLSSGVLGIAGNFALNPVLVEYIIQGAPSLNGAPSGPSHSPGNEPMTLAYFIAKGQTSTPTYVGITGDVSVFKFIVTGVDGDGKATWRETTFPEDFIQQVPDNDNIVFGNYYMFDKLVDVGDYDVAYFISDENQTLLKPVTFRVSYSIGTTTSTTIKALSGTGITYDYAHAYNTINFLESLDDIQYNQIGNLPIVPDSTGSNEFFAYNLTPGYWYKTQTNDAIGAFVDSVSSQYPSSSLTSLHIDLSSQGIAIDIIDGYGSVEFEYSLDGSYWVSFGSFSLPYQPFTDSGDIPFIPQNDYYYRTWTYDVDGFVIYSNAPQYTGTSAIIDAIGATMIDYTVYHAYGQAILEESPDGVYTWMQVNQASLTPDTSQSSAFIYTSAPGYFYRIHTYDSTLISVYSEGVQSAPSSIKSVGDSVIGITYQGDNIWNSVTVQESIDDQNYVDVGTPAILIGSFTGYGFMSFAGAGVILENSLYYRLKSFSSNSTEIYTKGWQYVAPLPSIIVLDSVEFYGGATVTCINTYGSTNPTPYINIQYSSNNTDNWISLFSPIHVISTPTDGTVWLDIGYGSSGGNQLTNLYSYRAYSFDSQGGTVYSSPVQCNIQYGATSTSINLALGGVGGTVTVVNAYSSQQDPVTYNVRTSTDQVTWSIMFGRYVPGGPLSFSNLETFQLTVGNYYQALTWDEQGHLIVSDVKYYSNTQSIIDHIGVNPPHLFTTLSLPMGNASQLGLNYEVANANLMIKVDHSESGNSGDVWTTDSYESIPNNTTTSGAVYFDPIGQNYYRLSTFDADNKLIKSNTSQFTDTVSRIDSIGASGISFSFFNAYNSINLEYSTDDTYWSYLGGEGLSGPMDINDMTGGPLSSMYYYRMYTYNKGGEIVHSNSVQFTDTVIELNDVSLDSFTISYWNAYTFLAIDYGDTSAGPWTNLVATSISGPAEAIQDQFFGAFAPNKWYRARTESSFLVDISSDPVYLAASSGASSGGSSYLLTIDSTESRTYSTVYNLSVSGFTTTGVMQAFYFDQNIMQWVEFGYITSYTNGNLAIQISNPSVASGNFVKFTINEGPFVNIESDQHWTNYMVAGPQIALNNVLLDVWPVLVSSVDLSYIPGGTPNGTLSMIVDYPSTTEWTSLYQSTGLFSNGGYAPNWNSQLGPDSHGYKALIFFPNIDGGLTCSSSTIKTALGPVTPAITLTEYIPGSPLPYVTGNRGGWPSGSTSDAQIAIWYATGPTGMNTPIFLGYNSTNHNGNFTVNLDSAPSTVFFDLKAYAEEGYQSDWFFVQSSFIDPPTGLTCQSYGSISWIGTSGGSSPDICYKVQVSDGPHTAIAYVEYDTQLNINTATWSSNDFPNSLIVAGWLDVAVSNVHSYTAEITDSFYYNGPTGSLSIFGYSYGSAGDPPQSLQISYDNIVDQFSYLVILGGTAYGPHDQVINSAHGTAQVDLETTISSGDSIMLWGTGGDGNSVGATSSFNPTSYSITSITTNGFEFGITAGYGGSVYFTHNGSNSGYSGLPYSPANVFGYKPMSLVDQDVIGITGNDQFGNTFYYEHTWQQPSASFFDAQLDGTGCRWLLGNANGAYNIYKGATSPSLATGSFGGGGGLATFYFTGGTVGSGDYLTIEFRDALGNSFSSVGPTISFPAGNMIFESMDNGATIDYSYMLGTSQYEITLAGMTAPSFGGSNSVMSSGNTQSFSTSLVHTGDYVYVYGTGTDGNFLSIGDTAYPTAMTVQLNSNTLVTTNYENIYLYKDLHLIFVNNGSDVIISNISVTGPTSGTLSYNLFPINDGDIVYLKSTNQFGNAVDSAHRTYWTPRPGSFDVTNINSGSFLLEWRNIGNMVEWNEFAQLDYLRAGSTYSMTLGIGVVSGVTHSNIVDLNWFGGLTGPIQSGDTLHIAATGGDGNPCIFDYTFYPTSLSIDNIGLTGSNLTVSWINAFDQISVYVNDTIQLGWGIGATPNTWQISGTYPDIWMPFVLNEGDTLKVSTKNQLGLTTETSEVFNRTYLDALEAHIDQGGCLIHYGYGTYSVWNQTQSFEAASFQLTGPSHIFIGNSWAIWSNPGDILEFSCYDKYGNRYSTTTSVT